MYVLTQMQLLMSSGLQGSNFDRSNCKTGSVVIIVASEISEVDILVHEIGFLHAPHPVNTKWLFLWSGICCK